MMPALTVERAAAPVEWCGWQDGMGLMPDFELWNLTAGIAGYPAGSSVSRATLEGAGFIVPPAPCLSPAAARERSHAFASTRRSMGTAHPFAR